ncbi:hypothetical protein ADUPG1_011605, partial [Aduncisulcus paluster]
EELLKRSKPPPLTQIYQSIHRSLSWRKHDGDVLIEKIIAEKMADGSVVSVSPTDVRKELFKELKEKLVLEGAEMAHEMAEEMSHFMYYHIKYALKKHEDVESPAISQRQVRGDDVFRFIPRTSSTAPSDPPTTHQVSQEL